LSSKIAALRGKNSVRDKKISSKVSATFGLPEGFDDPMHAMGVMLIYIMEANVIQYIMEEQKP